MTFRQTINKYLIGHRTTTIVVLCLFGLCLPRISVILSPIGNQPVFTVDERSALKEICIVVEPVEVETVGAEHMPAVVEHHILAGFHHLGLAVVKGSFAG